MEKIKILAIFFALILLLFGCGAKERISLDYMNGAFECELSWSVSGERLRAVVVAGERAEGQRDISIEFIEPESLCGVRIERVGTKTSSYIGDTSFGGGDFSCWLSIETLFDVGADTVISYETRANREGSEYIEIERKEAGKLCLYISKGSGLPVKLISGELEADVIYFNLRS